KSSFIPAAQPMEMPGAGAMPVPEKTGFWDSVHALEVAYHKDLEDDALNAANALLDLDRIIWQAHQDKESPEFISQARELFHELIVILGMRLSSAPQNCYKCLERLVDELLASRASYKDNKQWHEADVIRDCLKRAKIEVDDTHNGYSWRLSSADK